MDGLSIVVPVYQSLETLPVLVERTREALDGHSPFEIILVDDGSQPRTWSTICKLQERYDFVRGIRLGRNYGQHAALVAGIREAHYSVSITIDDDLQNPPEEIPKLLAQLTPEVDVVYGVSDEVAQGLWRRIAAKSIRLVLKRSLGTSNTPDISTFRAFRTQLRSAFSGDLGPGVSLDALLTWGTTRFENVTVRHDDREHGQSNYTIGKLVRFAIDTTTGYSVFPLQIASLLGLVTAGFGILVIAYVLIRLLVTGDSVPGFPFLASIVAFFAGMTLFALGVIGEYLARIHFRIMGKPTYFIAENVRDDS